MKYLHALWLILPKNKKEGKIPLFYRIRITLLR